MVISDVRARFLAEGNFQQAWERVIRSSHAENKDRIALRAFSAHLTYNLRDIIEEVTAGTYNPARAPTLYLPKPARTLRSIPVLSVRDRVLYQAMGNIIAEEASPHLAPLANHVFAHLPAAPSELFAVRPWPEQFRAFSEAYERVWKAGNQWVIETDIAAFYPSIDHQLLCDLIRTRWIADAGFLELLSRCLSEWAAHDQGPKLQRGLPQGYETSDVLATLFLLPVDEELVTKARYLRYVDDIRILADDPGLASRGLVTLDMCLQRRSLVLQTKKTVLARVVDLEDEKVKLAAKLSLIKTFAAMGLDQRKQLTAMFYRAVRQIRGLAHGFDAGLSLGSAFLWIQTGSAWLALVLLGRLRLLFPSLFRAVTQMPLKLMFLEAWRDIGNTPETSETRMVFALHRLEPDERIGAIALRLLEVLPWRSGIITAYLGRFHGSRAIVNGLIRELSSHKTYAWHLANCLRALGEVGEPSDFESLALEWIRNRDLTWPQRLAAVDVLQQLPDAHGALYAAIQAEHNPIVRSALLVACAFQAKTAARLDEVRLTIRICLESQDGAEQQLGIWLWRQFPELTWNSLGFQGALGRLQELVPEALQPAAPRPCYIRQTLERFYGVTIDQRIDFSKVLQDYDGAVGDLRKAVPYYHTDPNLYVGLINSFNHRLAIAGQQILGLSVPHDQFDNMLKSAGFSSALPQTSLHFGQCNSRRHQTPGFHPYARALGTWSQPVGHKEKEKIHQGLKGAYQELVDLLVSTATPVAPPSPHPP
jgi:retron-type reverse transcriptase